ncbi:MAG: CTP synthase [Candidatus Niyogibacteria bacterium CG10_big_fil_rev_8_21_14_0_10_46_36]|uniref:CTP synthase n=1 Tax=Candidatus Niyogibacteria bacterium CG10_big_fil_rev_8_21_14_0_10_46_36 TaxID=1974726 RepID=A0A2H0TE62_9BACT|nr:MAG: CTP synthase [Candidatus Niyogibacteria bacterium CG10_big_fil_rev_8_21_14_0_10_46_36]
MARYIFVLGGVMSGIGKGVATASIGNILKSYGFSVTAIKIDPYLNVDAGTMNPVEHGEVFVTDDGLECDQDIGNYERFLGAPMFRYNYMTTGQVYQSVIAKERAMYYGGKCVEVVPHITGEITERIELAARKTKADFVLIEVGGTVGEYQNNIFLEAGRMMKLKAPDKVMFIMVSYLPVPKMIGEMKTKPTQHAVRILNSIGIQPDMILARSAHPIDAPRKQKIAIFCNINEEDVVSAPDIESIYEIPINFEKDNLGKRVLAKFGLKRRQSNMREWRALVRRIKNIKKTVRIAVAGKYFATGNFMLSDSYISVLEAIKHAAWRSGFKPEIHWIDTEEYEKKPARVRELEKFDGIVVPGGFGKRGIEGKIKAIRYARTHNIPYLGLCYGMQLAVIEFSRNVGGMRKAHTTEIQSQTPHPVIATMPEQEVNLKNKDYGGSMRLGMYPCALKEGTTSFRAYKEKNIFERHRHRYEMNNDFRERLEEAGLVVAGTNPQRNLVEIIEIKNHPFFVGTQFHPELKSSPLKPHPLFREFLRVAVKKKK